ncbi:hypothetical protein KUCAC02_014377, partial [Chaenocephalus aceratus]
KVKRRVPSHRKVEREESPLNKEGEEKTPSQQKGEEKNPSHRKVKRRVPSQQKGEEKTPSQQKELLFSQRKEGDPEEEQDRLTELNSTSSVLLEVTVILETGSVVRARFLSSRDPVDEEGDPAFIL